MRLAKYLAHSGVASRRKAEELIAAGRVQVGGKVVTDPARDVEFESGVEVDGRPVGPEPREVWILNKPAGVTSTASEPGRRRAVTELIDSKRRLYPVGRLDADSTGLILLTNDGELANRLMHPRFEVPRTYRARLRRPPSDVDLGRLRDGVELEDGPTRRGEGAAGLAAGGRDHDQRGAQPPGAADGRGDRQRGRRPGADRVRAVAPRRARPREGAAAARRRATAALEGSTPMSDGDKRLWAVRGAAQAERNDEPSILGATEELMRELMRRNELGPSDFVSVILTCTDDLNAQFPAVGARAVGLDQVPLLCNRELDVPGAMERVIRVLAHYYAPAEHQPAHVYLGQTQEAARRPALGPMSSLSSLRSLGRIPGYVAGAPAGKAPEAIADEGIAQLASNESPFGPHPAVTEAIARAAAATNRYPDPLGGAAAPPDRRPLRGRAVRGRARQRLLRDPARRRPRALRARRRARLRLAVVLDLRLPRAALGRPRDPCPARRRATSTTSTRC